MPGPPLKHFREGAPGRSLYLNQKNQSLKSVLSKHVPNRSEIRYACTVANIQRKRPIVPQFFGLGPLMHPNTCPMGFCGGCYEWGRGGKP